MQTEDVLARLKPWRERNTRQAWRPITVKGDGLATASKFSGVPWLSAHEGWPECQGCRARMPLFLQLDLYRAPPDARAQFGDGLLQLFYCTSCEGGWEAFSRVSLVRIVPHSVFDQGSATTDAHVVFPVKRITGWTQIPDHPDPSDHEALGLVYAYDFKVKPLRTSITSRDPSFVADGVADDQLAEKISVAESGDKLGGWPLWIQGAEYPACPVCKAPMQLVFQVDSNDNLDFMFGDAGTGHITQCPAHREVVAFGWACS
jgi:uncharacterized protein YwqG